MRSTTTRRRFATLVTLGTALITLGPIGAAPVAADCSGPTLRFAPHDVDRGGTLSVTGSGWGDNCYDTGSPPDGEGVLGNPITGIEILIKQGSKEWLVARGSADDQFGFSIDIRVPTDLTPGEAELTARHSLDIGVFNQDSVLRVSDAEPVGPSSVTSEVPEFNQGSDSHKSESANSKSGESQDTASARSWPFIAIAGVAAAAALVGAVFIRWRSSGAGGE